MPKFLCFVVANIMIMVVNKAIHGWAGLLDEKHDCLVVNGGRE